MVGTISKPIYIEVAGKRILLGTAEIIEQHDDPVCHPMTITGVRIMKINMNRRYLDEVSLE